MPGIYPRAIEEEVIHRRLEAAPIMDAEVDPQKVRHAQEKWAPTPRSQTDQQGPFKSLDRDGLSQLNIVLVH